MASVSAGDVAVVSLQREAAVTGGSRTMKASSFLIKSAWRGQNELFLAVGERKREVGSRDCRHSSNLSWHLEPGYQPGLEELKLSA